MKHGICVIASFTLAACSVEPSQPPAAERTPEPFNYSIEPDFKHAEQKVADACPMLLKMRDAREIVSVTTYRQNVISSDLAQHGWTEWFSVSITLSRPLRSVPSDWFAAGQTCHFDVGQGGVLVSKRPCQRICGVSPQSGRALLPIR